MKPRQVFGFSVLVALGLHAAILLVPRIPERRDPGPPVIELTLESAQAAGAGPGAEQAAMRASAPARPAVAEPSSALPADPASAHASVPGAPGEESEASTPALSTAPSEPSAGANDQGQASTAAMGGADTGAAGFGGPAGVSGRDASGASGDSLPGAAASTTLAPRPRGEILPVYPRSAKKAGWQGVVTIRAFIDETGKVVSAVVLSSSGHESLDHAALEAVKKTRFDPAIQHARPVSSPLLIPVRFQLN